MLINCENTKTNKIFSALAKTVFGRGINMKNYFGYAVFRYGGIAACAMILIFCLWAVPISFGNSGGRQDFEPLFAGLPVDNFSLADMQAKGDASMSRIAYTALSDFFSYGAPDMFAFARVLDTEQFEEKGSHSGMVMQNSTLHILSVLWTRAQDAPEIISLSQSLYGGCMGDEKTNMLRRDGVYLLPLSYLQNGDIWYVMGALDVLFEVDDRGCVWTHSPFDGFKRFDGENASLPAGEIASMTSDENFAAAITSFGNIARKWGILAETTLLSASPAKDELGNDYYSYALSADAVLSVSDNPHYRWRPGGDIIYARCYEIIPLEQGGKYLMLLDPSEDGPYIDSGRMAKINGDGTITAVFSPDYANVFEEYGGYSVKQMTEEAARAKAWHKSHAK